MRDVLKTRRTFAVWAVAAAALCVLALAALRTPRGDALAQSGPSQAAPATQEAQSQQQEIDIREFEREMRVRSLSLNVKPLRDVAAEAKELLGQGRLGSYTRVDVTAKGERNYDGTLKPDTVVFNWNTGGDEAATSLAQRLVSALSESRLFVVLEGAKEVSIRFRLDESNAFLSFAADMPSAEHAKRLADVYSALLQIAAVTKNRKIEGELYKSAKFEAAGGRLTFTFEMPKENLSRIIADARAND